MNDNRQENSSIYKVVVNQERHYAIKSADQENLPDWKDTGKYGSLSDCINYISTEVERDSSQKEPQASSKAVTVVNEHDEITPLPLLPTQQWFFELLLTNQHHHNIAWIVQAGYRLDSTLSEQVIEYLLIHHHALRTRFVYKDGKWKQFFADSSGTGSFVLIDLTTVNETEQRSAVETAAAEQQTSLDLLKGPLFKLVLFDLGAQQPQRILLIMHQLIADAFSPSILMRDFQTVYMQLSEGQPIKLPTTATVGQWTEELITYSRSSELRQEMDYWLGLPWKDVLPLPVDYPDGKKFNTWESIDYIYASLTSEETQALFRVAPRFDNCQVRDVLLTALVQACSVWTEWPGLLVSPISHGRLFNFDRINPARTIGCFTLNNIPVVLKLVASSTSLETLKMIKEQLRSIPNQGLGYNVLRYCADDTEIIKQIQNIPAPELFFCYWSQWGGGSRENGFYSHAKESCGPSIDQQQIRPWLIYCTIHIYEKQIKLTLEYSKNVHRQTTIEQLAQRYIQSLRLLISEITDHINQ